MISSSTMVGQANLEQLYYLLNRASSCADTASQQQVYNQLSAAQENVQLYLGLAHIAANQSMQPTIRQMALIILKSALKRNQNIITFSPDQQAYFRNQIIHGNYTHNQIMANSQKSLISLMAIWNNQIDFQILEYILRKMSSTNQKQQNWGFQAMYIIFQDIRFKTQNISCFEKPQFAQFLQVFIRVFTETMNRQNNEIITKSLMCMNLLLKYMHLLSTKDEIQKNYLITYLIPIINNQNFDHKTIGVALDGITQIAQVHPETILTTESALNSIIGFHHSNVEVTKQWLSLLLDIIQKDIQQQKIKSYLSILLPKVINYLVFTKQDQQNLNMEMEEESNPYEYEDDNNDEEIQDNQMKQRDCGYTMRKLSVMILQRLLDQHTDEVWSICQPYLQHLLKSHQVLERECGILMLGIIFGKMQDHLEFVKQAIPNLLAEISNVALPDIIRCTSMWVISRVSQMVVAEKQLYVNVQKVLVACLQNSTSQVRDTAYSTLDELISHSEDLPEYLPQIVACMEVGIRDCKGKPLHCVLKTCQTFYQKHHDKIPQNITQMIVNQLCSKWMAHSKVESVMSPILQCLVTIASARSEVFKKYAFSIFSQAYKLLQNENQKTVRIRAIDLLSSIISLNYNQINQVLAQNQYFHERLGILIKSDENQIRNFSYGLLGDICKVTKISNFAQNYIQTIGATNIQSNLASCSNALTCLTDLIIAHPEIGLKYCQDIMALAIKKLRTNNLHSAYAFNFARIFCRLGNVNPVAGSQFIKQNLQTICVSLRAHEHQKLTDQAYRGLLLMIEQAPQQATDSFAYLVLSFTCYQCGDQQVEKEFLTLLKAYRSSLSPTQWSDFLRKPLFLPAMANKIQIISK